MRIFIAAIMLAAACGQAVASGGHERYDTPKKKACIKEAREKFPPDYIPGPAGTMMNKSAGLREKYYHGCLEK
jgi:hypothetical protein